MFCTRNRNWVILIATVIALTMAGIGNPASAEDVVGKGGTYGGGGADDSSTAPGKPAEPPAFDTPARLVIEFEGGVLGNDMAELLDKLSPIAQAIPARTRVVAAGDETYCLVLEREYQVPAALCTDKFVEALKQYSGSHGAPLATLKPGTKIELPDLRVSQFQFRRDYLSTSAKGQQEADQLTRNPGWRMLLQNDEKRTVGKPDAGTAPQAQGAEIRSLTFTGYRWIIPVTDDKILDQIESLAYSLTTLNRSVALERNPARKEGIPRKFTGLTPLQHYQGCLTGTAKDPSSYADYLTGEYDVSMAVACDGGQRRSQVFLIDTPVYRHPDISDALAPDYTPVQEGVTIQGGANTACGKVGASFEPRLHHATFLAGIIASNGKMSGFTGIAPAAAAITPIHWLDASQESELLEKLRNAVQPTDPQVFVLPGEFRPVVPSSTPGNYWQRRGKDVLSEFVDESARFKIKKLNLFIKEQRIPFIVSAGQADDSGGTGVTLRNVSPYSPQNLGDLPNVIVVTACTDCDQSRARVWDKANHSAPFEDRVPLVQLAAPSGDVVPGIITDESVGQTTGGTSAAAAFTAGVTAQMLACYPRRYIGRPSRVKERLLVTARANLGFDETTYGVLGTLDPRMALTDPQRSWVKLPDQPLQEVKVVHWCTDEVRLNNDGDERPDASYLPLTRRISNLGDGRFLGRQVEKNEEKNELSVYFAGPGQPMKPNDPIAAVEFPGSQRCALRITQVQDLILSDAVKKVEACALIKICGE